MTAILPPALSDRGACGIVPADWPVAEPAAGLPLRRPFPVTVPFHVRPDLVKLAGDEEPLWLDADWGETLRDRRRLLASPVSGGIGMEAAADARQQAGRLAAVHRAVALLAGSPAGRRLGLSASRGGLVARAAGYQTLGRDDGGALELQPLRPDADWLRAARPGFLGGSPALFSLGALALGLQEDLVLMEADPASGLARAAVLQVAFPSAWSPTARVGQDLLALHAPVADNGPLQRAASGLSRALLEKGPFVRWVWTLTTDSRRRVWPPRPIDDVSLADDPLARLWFRLERQVSLPLGDGYALFLIRVQRRPLAEVLAEAPGRLDQLQRSLLSMSEAMIRYKGLVAVRAALCD